jgi:hypothetical protein
MSMLSTCFDELGDARRFQLSSERGQHESKEPGRELYVYDGCVVEEEVARDDRQPITLYR